MLEIFAVSVPQTTRRANEDAFWIRRGTERIFIALADGTGRSNQAAGRVLRLFGKLTAEVVPTHIIGSQTWERWVKLLDSSLLDAAESTFLGMAANCGDIMTGAVVGDSRLFWIKHDGGIQIIVGEKKRLGSGAAQAATFAMKPTHDDLLVAATDGAYSPMSLAELRNIVVTQAARHLSNVPPAIIERASKYGGLVDDATVIAARRR